MRMGKCSPLRGTPESYGHSGSRSDSGAVFFLCNRSYMHYYLGFEVFYQTTIRPTKYSKLDGTEKSNSFIYLTYNGDSIRRLPQHEIDSKQFTVPLRHWCVRVCANDIYVHLTGLFVSI